jgi:6-phospho-5-dehydro-2-deoxy-D-gluconate aldolase
MGFVPMAQLLADAKKGGYAIGQFNINGLQWAKAILVGAESQQSPVIAAASDRLIDYLGGFQTVVAMMGALTDELGITVPVVLHLDHGLSMERCKKAIDAGFSSVMFDGSHYPIDENIDMTKEVVAYAHARNVSVEGEVGTVGGMEDGLIAEIKYADLEECQRFVRETNVDALAAALGSVHGKYKGEPKLGFNEMAAISARTNVPLVLHGASGIPDEQLQRAIKLGHAKININTECMIAWSDACRTTFAEQETAFEPRLLLQEGLAMVQATVEKKIKQFGAANKAAGSTSLQRR